LAGGVDLSVDPFELVGFAKAGALAKDEMRVYDRRSAGFWPGEGCGVLVLMRLEDALARSQRVYAVVKGWGVSSDGGGGITRPEAQGQMLALERAYRRAGYGVETVTYFEGHGTGTSVGDATELKALSEARRRANPDAPPAAVGSVKANIGHTKAAAGVAGMLKAVMALHTQTLPPTTGCEEPHAELTVERPALRVLRKGERWPRELPLRAGVSAMGFGGINTHVTLEAPEVPRRRTVSQSERALLSSTQDAELFLLTAPDRESLLSRVNQLLGFAARLSRSELTDLAAALARTADESARVWRAALVASSAAELAGKLETLQAWLGEDANELRLDVSAGLFLGACGRARVGFLFPGQAADVYLNGGALARRFECVEELYAQARLPLSGDTRSTLLAQPAIVTASMAGLRVLERLGIEARVAVGHSLGELTALHWAGAFDEGALLRVARLRARAMASGAGAEGKMFSVKARVPEVKSVLNGDPVVISGFNSPSQTVLAGEASAVDKLAERFRAAGHTVVGLNVSHAFHSPLMSGAVPLLAEGLRGEELRGLQCRVVSTITGTAVTSDGDLRELLCRQLTAPVRFVEAATEAAAEVDLFIEVGPGQILCNLAAEFIGVPCVSLDAGGESLKGLLKAFGAAFVAGAADDAEALFAGRFARPFDLDWRPRFFANPCELAPLLDENNAVRREAFEEAESVSSPVIEPLEGATDETALEVVRRLVAERAELPLEAVKDEHTLLGDLHLNSITVSQLVVDAARLLGLTPPVAPTEYAHATIAEAAAALETLSASGDAATTERHPQGVDSWVRSFTVELVEEPLQDDGEPKGSGGWRVFAPEGHALASSLREAFARFEDGGVVVCLPPRADEQHVGLLLEAARAVNEEGAANFVLVQHGRGAAAFARTLQQEMPRVRVRVVNVPEGHAQ
ncbi:MAG TPA: acyltransferase domain-containing protein, partial [Pyrinomonadaceae bacterium]